VSDDASAATLLVCVRSLDDAKAFDSTHVRWMSVTKAQCRGSAKAVESAVGGQAERPRSLVDVAPDLIVRRHLSGHTLPRGLYVGLLQLRSSRDAISVMVSDHQPNVLPYVKVRDNPNVTRYRTAPFFASRILVTTIHVLFLRRLTRSIVDNFSD